MLVEDDELAKRQLAEDLDLYGSRLDPPDVLELDEHDQATSLPSKRSPEVLDNTSDRPTKARTIKELEHATITAIDGNSGVTPLDAWLNQSAVPASVHLPVIRNEKGGSSTDDLASKELEELKVFRTVHVERIEKSTKAEARAGDVSNLEPSVQIFLRNILDRYPLLPSYLALRLANANTTRVKRLEDQRRRERKDLWTFESTGDPDLPSLEDSEFPHRAWSDQILYQVIRNSISDNSTSEE